MQPQYVDTETFLFGKLVDELSHISEKVSFSQKILYFLSRIVA